MKKYLAERLEYMVPSGIRAINEKAVKLEQQGEHVLHFEIGRPDFDTPAYIKEACIESLRKGDVFYTSNFGDKQLREAIAEKLNRDNGCHYTYENILVTVGLAEGVFDVLASILDPGDEILIPDPVWINYLNIPKLLGAVPVSYRLLEENDYQIDVEELRGKISDKTKAIVVSSPHNPTGSVLGEAVLTDVAKLAIENDLIVLSDEIYERLIYDGKRHFSIASLPEMAQRTVTLNGFSKAYSMTGWRIGYIAAPAEWIVAINKLHQHNTACAASFVQKAAVVALREEKNEVTDMVYEYKRRRDYAVNAINQIQGLSCRCPDGAFYIFINCKELSMSSVELCDYLLSAAKIALVPGSIFGDEGEGYIRMSYASSYENIVEGCGRLKSAIDNLRSSQSR